MPEEKNIATLTPEEEKELRDAAIRKRAVQLAVDGIEKQFGKGSIRRMGDNPLEGIEAISTRCIGIDNITGVGGIPRGRITELFGGESMGKTSLALHLIAEAQGRGMIAAFVDAEHALSTDWATRLGVNVDDLFISQPEDGEQALSIVEALVRSGGTGIIVVDSVPALVPRAELEGNIEDSLPAAQARMMSKSLRMLTAVTNKSKTAVVFINQLRDKLMMPGQGYGPKEGTTGGRALKFYSSLRLEIKRIAAIKQGESIIGAETRIKAVKNKMARPFLECKVDLIYDEGISSVNSIIDTAVEWKILAKDGKSYSYAGEKLAVGRDAVAEKLNEDEPLQAKIKAEILEAVAIYQGEKSAQKSTQIQ